MSTGRVYVNLGLSALPDARTRRAFRRSEHSLEPQPNMVILPLSHPGRINVPFLASFIFGIYSV